MKLVIAGSRDITDYPTLKEFVAGLELPITEVVSGKARGVDTLGERYAKEIGVPVKPFPAEWNNLDLPEGFNCPKKRKDGTVYNACAGFYRNEQMAQYADAGAVLARKGSSGSIDMATRLRNHNKRLYAKRYGT